MANVKHVGKLKNGDRVVILFKTVPNEYHQCLVTETKALPSVYHDRLMELVESDEGQQSADLADLLGRRFFADGSNVLNTLHSKGFIKKVETKHVLLTPNVATSVPLNQVNDILNNHGPGKKPVTADDYAQPALSVEMLAEPVVETTVPVSSSGAVTESNALLMQAEFHEREAARLRSLVAASSPMVTTTVNVQEKKRGRPPKATTLG
jgi:hypothetical protein